MITHVTETGKVKVVFTRAVPDTRHLTTGIRSEKCVVR